MVHRRGCDGEAPIGRITTSGVVTEFAAPMARYAQSIVAGPDGDLWYTSSDGIGRITTAGVATDFNSGFDRWQSLPTDRRAGRQLWFTQDNGHVGKMTTAGVLTMYSAGLDTNTEPLSITRGPDGAMWFTDYALDEIGEVTTARGRSPSTPLASLPGAGPQEITTGPDGNLWFTESQGLRIARADITTSQSAAVAEAAAVGVAVADRRSRPPTVTPVRVSGPDRINTAVAISEHEYPTRRFSEDGRARPR